MAGRDTLVSSDEPLEPTRTIGIEFDGLKQAMAFRLMRTTPKVTQTIHDISPSPSTTPMLQSRKKISTSGSRSRSISLPETSTLMSRAM